MSAKLTLEWAKMPIHRVSWKEKLTDPGVAKGTLTLEDGEKIIFPRIEIKPTPVHLILGVWWVDACVGYGMSENGDRITVSLPREPCGFSLETGGVAALAVPYTCEVTLADGLLLKGDLIPPDCPLHLVPLYAEPLEMRGSLEWV
jgi:hypothetical protein